MKDRREFLKGPISVFQNVMRSTAEKKPIETKASEKDHCPVSREIGALGNDFSESELKMETMRLGFDPSNMSRSDMLELIGKALCRPEQTAEELSNDASL